VSRSIRSLFLLLSLICLVIFVIQNRQLITIVIFNSPVAFSLSIGIWVLIAILAGFLSSIIIQLLNPVEIIPVADTYAPKSTKKSKKIQDNNLEDEDLDEDEWNIEEPPMETTPIRDRLDLREERFNTEQRERELKFTENQTFKDAENPSLTNDNYEKNYEEKQAPPPPKINPPPRRYPRNNKNNVYDANYRVINPPYQTNPEESNYFGEDDFDF
jgi:hypothetical protein